MTTQVDEALRRAAKLIVDAPSVCLACHVGPDGDALGSLLGFLHLARDHGVAVCASWPAPVGVAPHYRFLPGLDLVCDPAAFPARPDLMIVFDCGSLDRLGELAPAAIAARDADRLIVLDHHATNQRFGSLNVIDTEAAATAVLTRRLADELGWALNRPAALCLYTGLVTDTGRFQHANTTPAVFALAGELATFGLPIAEMTRQLFEQHRFAYLQLMAECIRRAQLDGDLRLVSTWVTAEDCARFAVDLAETEGLIDVLRRAEEAEVSCVLREVPEGVRVSLRATSGTDVGAIATRFGGGGHRFAAGYTQTGTVSEVLARLRAALAAGG